MAQIKHKYWTLNFWDCCQEPTAIFLIICFGTCGLACAQAMALHKVKSQSPTPFMGFCGVLCCGCFGLAANRSAVRQAAGIPVEYWPDCVVYSSNECCCCLVAQELHEAKNLQK
jgi:hypothetical protein